MPIQKTEARLWFDSKEEEEAYDDKMISNIELKSTDFDDENFSPVFTRATQEFFLEPSERFRNDAQKVFKPIRSNSFEGLVDRYFLFKPNHTFYRNWTLDKFLGGFGIGYLLLRELPLRNFYARCFVMYIFLAKFFDHLHNPWPFGGSNGTLVMAADRWAFWDLRCYDNIWRAVNFVEIPSIANKVRQARVWNGKQPGHILRSDIYWIPHNFGPITRTKREVAWDGTMNMPIFRLADPKHKDSYMMVYQ